MWGLPEGQLRLAFKKLTSYEELRRTWGFSTPWNSDHILMAYHCRHSDLMRTGTQVALPQAHFGKEQEVKKRSKHERRIKIEEQIWKTKEKKKERIKEKEIKKSKRRKQCEEGL